MPSIVSAERSRWVPDRLARGARTSSRQLIGQTRPGSVVGRPRRPARPSRIWIDALGTARHVVLVGDEHDRAARAVQVDEQGEDVGGRGRVEVAGRLVGEDQRGLGHQGAGDRDALLLAARQLAGPVVGAVGEADAVEGGDGTRSRAVGRGRRPRRPAGARRCARPSSEAAG